MRQLPPAGCPHPPRPAGADARGGDAGAGLAAERKAQQELDDKKRKPSREIRIDAMREAIEFAQRTSARGRAKVVLIYPAERMNHVTANALLKTLEEPPGELRFVLATEAAHRLLPTIRSRCLSHAMALAAVAEHGARWLAAQGLAPADALAWLRAAGGRPEEALTMAQSGLSVAQWRLFPQAMARGDTTSVADWGPAQLVDALQNWRTTWPPPAAVPNPVSLSPAHCPSRPAGRPWPSGTKTWSPPPAGWNTPSTRG